MKFRNHIPDGMTAEAFINERRGHHQAVRLTYRPLRYTERQVVQDNLRSKTGADAATAIFKTICRQLASWDLKHGESVAPITVEGLTITEPLLIDRLFNIVMGFDIGDVDPLSTEAQVKSQADAEFEAMLSNKPVGDVVAEAAVKN